MSERDTAYMALLDAAVMDSDVERILEVREQIAGDPASDLDRPFLLGVATTYANDLATAAMTPEQQLRGVPTDLMRRINDDIEDDEFSEPSAPPGE
jgi:hypothetical protein